ncbi:DoxX family protein [Lacihabitans lacunae]|uniref:DoxX family protein n=1 Tax=Lacihabitans lacunae TaxID=1028214 RepID=A0ABV7YYY7_9BACT
MENQKSTKVLNIVLWVLQVVFAGMFIMAGFSKVAQSPEELVQMLPWVADVPAGLVKFIGVSELLGGIGLLLPALLKIKPELTSYAAYGLAVVMLLAAFFHGSRGEFSAIGTNVVIGGILAYVGWARIKKAPIAAKS